MIHITVQMCIGCYGMYISLPKKKFRAQKAANSKFLCIVYTRWTSDSHKTQLCWLVERPTQAALLVSSIYINALNIRTTQLRL